MDWNRFDGTLRELMNNQNIGSGTQLVFYGINAIYLMGEININGGICDDCNMLDDKVLYYRNLIIPEDLPKDT